MRGRPRHEVTSLRDLNERRQGEDLASSSFRLVFENAIDAVVLADGEGHILDANAAACALFGYSEDELRRIGRSAILDEADPRTAAALETRAATGSFRGELDFTRSDGSIFVGDCSVRGFSTAEGEMRVVAAIRDVTERKQIEASLRRANAIIAAVSVAAERLLETPSLEGGLGAVLERIGAATQSSRVFVYEHRPEETPEPVFVRRYRWVADGIPTLDDREELYAFRYRSAGWSRWAEVLSQGGVVSGHLREVPASEQPELAIHGVKSILVVPITVGGVWWGYVGVEDCVVEREWSEAEIDALRAAAGILGAALARMQAEERLRLSEEQLRHSQKMEAVGRLAGGIAHDFNNLLLAIQGFSELAVSELPDGAEAARRDIEEVRRATDRAAGMTRQLLAFSRRQITRPRVIDVNDVVVEMNKMLRRLIGEHIELVTVLDSLATATRADPGQLEQVVANLAVNARDAMPEGGRLTIATHAVSLAERSGTLEPGPYVVLSVSDTGEGMDTETKARIFDPYFTTKKGKGTGLGLSTVYGIVQQSGGDVFVASEEGAGTTFEVYLPRYEPLGAAETRARDGATPRGNETVLVVEDEEQVRTMMVRMLERLGYRVMSASSGDAALALLTGTRSKDGIDLLVTDLVMPGLPSRELVARVTETWPDVKVLYVTGYSEDADIRRHASVGSIALLEKPFTESELARTVRGVLETRPS